MQTYLKRSLIGQDATRSFVQKMHAEYLQNHPNYYLFLEGGLGVGKTFSVQELLKLHGVTQNITSPTYTLVQEYQNENGQKFAHFDFYRLESPEEFFARGFDEIASDPEVTCFIEWPERISDAAKQCFSGHRFALVLSHGVGASMRKAKFIGD